MSRGNKLQKMEEDVKQSKTAANANASPAEPMQKVANVTPDNPVDYEQVRCPNGEELMGRGINLLMRPSLSSQDTEDVVTALRKVADYYLAGSP